MVPDMRLVALVIVSVRQCRAAAAVMVTCVADIFVTQPGVQMRSFFNINQPKMNTG